MLLSRVFPELWKFGTHERADRRTPLMLWATAVTAGLGRFSTPRLQGATAGYQVTAARTLVITRALFSADTATRGWAFGYSDSDRGMSNAADGANPVDLDSLGAGAVNALKVLLAETIYEASVYYEIPATKFPRVFTTAAAAATHWWMFFAHEV